MNNSIITAVRVCPTVYKRHSPFHSKHVTGKGPPLHSCTVLHNTASLCAGEKRLSVLHQVEELVAFLEVKTVSDRSVITAVTQASQLPWQPS